MQVSYTIILSPRKTKCNKVVDKETKMRYNVITKETKINLKVSERMTMAYYLGICKEIGNVVREEDAMQYVRKRGYMGKPEIVIPWFFSGNWVKIDNPNESDII